MWKLYTENICCEIYSYQGNEEIESRSEKKKQTNKTFIQTFEGLFVISGLEFERNFGQTYNAKMTKSGV